MTERGLLTSVFIERDQNEEMEMQEIAVTVILEGETKNFALIKRGKISGITRIN
jgi:hypothetical protein